MSPCKKRHYGNVHVATVKKKRKDREEKGKKKYGGYYESF